MAKYGDLKKKDNDNQILLLYVEGPGNNALIALKHTSLFKKFIEKDLKSQGDQLKKISVSSTPQFEGLLKRSLIQFMPETTKGNRLVRSKKLLN